MKPDKKENYFENLYATARSLSGSERDIAVSILDFATCTYADRMEKTQHLKSLLIKTEPTTIADIFSGSRFNALLALFGEELAVKFKKIWDRASDYSYAQGYYRRSFRTKQDISIYLDKNLDKLRMVLHLYEYDFSLLDYLTVQNYEINYYVLPDLIAVEIDDNNSEVIEALRNIIYSDNNAALLSHSMIMGLLMSQNRVAHTMIGELLIAARLQEGLRQSIVEKIDEASMDAFLYMLKIIIDHDLIRYSSVVRALDVWTGLGIEAQKPAVAKKCIETGYRCLTDHTFLEECINSRDSMHIYMALWAIAVREIKDTKPIIERFMAGKEKHKKLVGLYFLNESGYSDFMYDLSHTYLNETDEEVLYWILVNYPTLSLYQYSEEGYAKAGHKTSLPADIAERKFQFDELKRIVDRMPKKEITFKESVFPWIDVTLTEDFVTQKMLYIVGYDMNDTLTDELLDYTDKMSADTRHNVLCNFVARPKTEKQRAFLFASLSDKSMSNRESALKHIDSLTLSPDEFSNVEKLLSLKTGTVRQASIKLLLKLDADALFDVTSRLIADKNEQKRLAALDIISSIEKKESFASIYDACLELIKQVKHPTEKEQVLIEKLLATDKPEYSKENGFGLYNPSAEVMVPPLTVTKDFSPEHIFTLTEDEVKTLYTDLYHLIYQHRDYEYEVEMYDGSRSKVVLGASYSIQTIKRNRAEDEEVRAIDNYPLPDIWRGFLKDHNLGYRQLLELQFYEQIEEDIEREPWFDTLLHNVFPMQKVTSICAFLETLDYRTHIQNILSALMGEFEKQEVFAAALDMMKYITLHVPQDKFTESYSKQDESRYYWYSKDYVTDANEISFWLSWMNNNVYDTESFKESFYIRYTYYRNTSFEPYYKFSLSFTDFARAYDEGIIDTDEMYKELMGRQSSRDNIRQITTPEGEGYRGNQHLKSFPFMKEFEHTVVERILDLELKRGDLPTEVSSLASKIVRYEGMTHFVDILVGMNSETFVRGYNYISENPTKKEIFSHLLKVCYPKQDEDEKLLKKLLKGRSISEKRLLEAAMYAPQWIDIVEKYLGWKGLRSAAWYFQAHVNEGFSAQKETIVAHYSPIVPADFNDGAFDTDWFNDAYKTLGKKRFELLYEAAKYISGGANHRRSQLFADAVLGKLKLTDMKKSIKEKRNKDHLLCYSLIPIKKDKLKETLRRYECIQEFLKESKQFGAQRRESEAKTAAIALGNLARNAGYSDVTRLTWNMETQKIKEIMPYLSPKVIEGTELYIEINEEGKASIKAIKNGKELKGVPTKLKKNTYVTELRDIQKSLKDQYTRARLALERAMEAENGFTLQELVNLQENPVIAPLIKHLVFMTGDTLGYLENGRLTTPFGSFCEPEPDAMLYIAHPVHLYESGQWSLYQKDLFERQIVQPFKQVFRELYRPNEDELAEATISRRYAGHQIQPKKTVALLKGRLWTVSYEEGLQKVYYKENIIAKLYALADWFSPADVEAPTLETVEFFDRLTYKPIPVENIPKVIFSEVMRDVDLVVSVAHAGSVDPEASLSTVEMRAAIAVETLDLLGIENVIVKGSHAHIAGKLGEYTVHLGSGIVHRQAGGALHIIPVHSQHRGRLFLPFMDEDPKTAEILSKVLLLANDTKIKDPNILEQIKV
ncbi:hypothetical protein AM501_14390 [Aneurinibacillus migulanus]|uniref:DUF4132 domain-containing protein n=1 Tax=Aneurinibacillus migulanus TaxID=47500 RepID=UPI0005B764CD|nr:DUF4132 domain-containing protein [Aneurinibacillus migulanus]KIV57138.1 hypothetical protein TS64_07550 [Aneurinibacillus migulanus]KPD07600.1 hypothetical protein AM501_14390 [Aneurinibacillus migulanus]CEH28820.1 Uncharacterized protein BN1090_A2_01243 [Aneurinibacillus migulanus]